jgi:hypothetical protein
MFAVGSRGGLGACAVKGDFIPSGFHRTRRTTAPTIMKARPMYTVRRSASAGCVSYHRALASALWRIRSPIATLTARRRKSVRSRTHQRRNRTKLSPTTIQYAAKPYARSIRTLPLAAPNYKYLVPYRSKAIGNDGICQRLKVTSVYSESSGLGFKYSTQAVGRATSPRCPRFKTCWDYCTIAEAGRNMEPQE